jgi:hypothetical protein
MANEMYSHILIYEAGFSLFMTEYKAEHLFWSCTRMFADKTWHSQIIMIIDKAKQAGGT